MSDFAFGGSAFGVAVLLLWSLVVNFHFFTSQLAWVILSLIFFFSARDRGSIQLGCFFHVNLENLSSLQKRVTCFALKLGWIGERSKCHIGNPLCKDQKKCCQTLDFQTKESTFLWRQFQTRVKNLVVLGQQDSSMAKGTCNQAW